MLAPEPAERPQANNNAGTSVLIVGVVEMSVLSIMSVLGMMGRMAVAASVLVLAIGCAGGCLLYTSPSPRDGLLSRMPSSA